MLYVPAAQGSLPPGPTHCAHAVRVPASDVPHAPGTVWCTGYRGTYRGTAGGEYFKYTFLALVCERGINAVIGAMGVLCLGGSGLKIPLLDILWSGTSQMFATAGSNPHANPSPDPSLTLPLNLASPSPSP